MNTQKTETAMGEGNAPRDPYAPLKMTKRMRELTGSKKKSFYTHIVCPNSKINTASYWDGGSHDKFVVYNTETGERKYPPSGNYPTFQAEYVLQPCEVMIQTGTFCGKPATPSIWYRSDEAHRIEPLLINEV